MENRAAAEEAKRLWKAWQDGEEVQQQNELFQQQTEHVDVAGHGQTSGSRPRPCDAAVAVTVCRLRGVGMFLVAWVTWAFCMVDGFSLCVCCSVGTWKSFRMACFRVPCTGNGLRLAVG